ncbi:MAG: DUF2924 domain-containing protein [Phenylobacterium sp.]|uniref:DUF2924 domain-containing protein n=1 Tax=Phenylobacterium sp. TaxID=1871053 RepID=UPI002735DCA3|nr:DUF2924 domain-containing protein [Phenylobacterium sp.]MDP3747661.1 DUF2924 domain-containing protein [Phenylobacterium sp.]
MRHLHGSRCGIARSNTARQSVRVVTILEPSVRGRQYSRVVHRRRTFVPRGYVHQGRTYKSLSAVARAITGTRWNGPRFFGLRNAGEAA